MLHMLNLDGIDMMCDLQFLFMRTMCWSDIMFLEKDYLLIMLKTEKISIWYFDNKKRNEQATTISVVKTHFLFKIVARSCLIVKNCVKIMVNKGILGCKNLRQRINREEFWWMGITRFVIYQAIAAVVNVTVAVS